MPMFVFLLMNLFIYLYDCKCWVLFWRNHVYWITGDRSLVHLWSQKEGHNSFIQIAWNIIVLFLFCLVYKTQVMVMVIVISRVLLVIGSRRSEKPYYSALLHRMMGLLSGEDPWCRPGGSDTHLSGLCGNPQDHTLDSQTSQHQQTSTNSQTFIQGRGLLSEAGPWVNVSQWYTK